VRVVDAAGPIGAYCSKLLSDLGAAVVVVEPAGGDELRRRPPFGDGGEPLVFAAYHAGKELAAVDLDGPDAVTALAAVSAGADVVIVAPPLRTCPGFDGGTGRPAWAPDAAIVCAVTPFGLGGPYAGRRTTHLVSYAVGGGMCRMGTPEGPPLVVPGQVDWDLAATHAALAIVAALDARPRAGSQVLDISAQEVEATFDFYFERYEFAGAWPTVRSVPVGIPPTGTWQCADGVLEISAHQHHHWAAFLHMLDDPEELSEPALQDMAMRRELADGLVDVVAELMAPHRRHDLLEKGQSMGLPVALVNTPAEFVADAQLQARRSFTTVALDGGAPVTVPRSPLRASVPITRDPHNPDDAVAAARPAPLPDRHGRGALAGLRVLSFGAFVAGNTAGTLLASLGADVVKVETAARAESIRNRAYGWDHRVYEEPSGIPVTPMSASLSRGTRGLALDASTPAGAELVRRLVAETDVVVENFGVSTMKRWGLAFDDLLTVNPRLVMLSLSGYGRTGPRAGYLAYAANISNFTGLTSLWANAGMLSDFATAAHGALAILAARRLVAATGAGIHLDVCQTEVMAALLAPVLLDPLVHGRDPEPAGNVVTGAILSGVYRCAGTDAWLAVEITDDDGMAALAGLFPGDRDLEAALAAWCADRSHHSAAQVLQRAGIAAGAVQDYEDVYRDPQLWARGFPVRLSHPDIEAFECAGSPLRMSATPGRWERLGPRIGEHTDEILRDWLGCDDDELAAHESSGAVFRG
jgi:crotonobetainyl-CoA:carnitine CoA-transferase CaiB-like acyl-CoA transferase